MKLAVNCLMPIGLVLALTGCASRDGEKQLSSISGWRTGFPKASPERAALACQGRNIIVSNAAFSMSWRLTEKGPQAQWVRDERRGHTLSLTGEVFQIILTNGHRYAASALLPEGKPRVSALAPQGKASCLAQRIPGRQLELPLRSEDGRLRVVWRVIAHDGANYVRQEIVMAARENCDLKEVVWLEEDIPGARTAGRVDGSPLVAGNFFFGCEDPQALNLAETVRRKLGVWSPDDVELDQPRQKTWPVDAALLRAGTNEFVFQYDRGPHRLDIGQVALLEDGRVVARDEHHGRTGVEHVDNEYSLALTQVRRAARYELAAQLGSDPTLQVLEGERVESFGQVLLRDYTGRANCRLRRDVPIRQGERLTQSFVMGVAPPGQMRRAFLDYLERERAHPYRPFLHYNSWYDIAWHPFALNESNCLEAIRICGDNFIKPHGVPMDAMVFDDGWDDPKTLWRFHHGFPKGFTPLAKLCRRYGTRVGVWLSPFGGYGTPREQRLKYGRAQGYETNAAGFSLAGPKYYAAFKAACVRMIRKYGINHFKFDGIASGMYANGSGAEYTLDTEALRRLMLELRQADPDLYINFTTGSWPSPFWLRYADSLWRQGGDMGLAGKGSHQQQWLTYRDQEVYRNIVRKGPLYPLNSLMTQGVAYSRLGAAGDPTFNAAGFKDDVRAFFGSGTSLQELYVQPGRLTARDWTVLAEAAQWSRTNADVLADTHWIGGDPSKLEVYGYASWSPRKGILMLRNPDDQPREIALDVGTAFELPPDAVPKFSLIRPWAEDAFQAPLTAEAGQPLTLTLKSFEVVVFEAVPRQ